MKKILIQKDFVLVGSDIEVFLVDVESKEFRSSVGLIEGTKDEPYELTVSGCCTQLDNVSTEFNVPPVSINDAKTMFKNIEFVKSYLTEKFKKDNLEIQCCASARFDFGQLLTPEANIFGCDPDYNAWFDGEPNDRPELEDSYFRCAGGHVHIGYPKPSKAVNMKIIQALDLTLGLPSLFLDSDRERRSMYGKAGAFRHKAFGVEYRVLSNFWIENGDLVNFIFEGVKQAIDLVNNKVDLLPDRELFIKAIDTYDLGLAEALLIKYNVSISDKLDPIIIDALASTI